MRCPYCGGFNSERASFCVYCGRDLTSGKQVTQRQQPAPPQQPPYQQPRPTAAPPPQGHPGRPTPATQQPGQVPTTQRRRAPTAPPTPQQAPAAPPTPPVPAAPEAPAPFPPRTLAQLQALEQGALSYTVLDTTTNGQWKKIVRIVYPRCAAWQQVATLLKVFKEQQETRFETIIIQGHLSPEADVYAFTNGQLTFDRNVRLGSQTQNRYRIETGNGFESDSVRIVLSE